MAEVKIDKGVPMPNTWKGRPAVPIYPWAEMEIGDSFACNRPAITTAWRNCAIANKRYAPKKFVARRMPEGIRIWRIA